MRELRLVGVDEGAVTLETLDGEKLRLPVDEQVRSAVRSAAVHSTKALSLTPREIQDRIRAGHTIAEIVEATGVAEDFVSKFAQPVMDELAHIIASALAIRITIAGDRFNDPTQVEFGDLIQERLAANSAKDISWSSKRIAGGTWQLECNYTISEHRAQSIWHYEPRRFHLEPENEAAIALSNSETIDGPIAKLRSLNAIPEAPSSAGSASLAPATAPAAFRKFEETVQASEVVTTSTVEEDSESIDVAGSTTDLLEEMRKRRESQPQTSATDIAADEEIGVVEADGSAPEFDVEPEDNEFQLDVVEDLEEISESEDAFVESHDEAPQAETIDSPVVEELDSIQSQTNEEVATEPQPKKSRASMPSWDEIVFGTKADD